MLYIMNLLDTFELKVELPIIIEIDNKGCIDLINNWSVLVCIRYIDIKKNFICKLKEQNIIKAIWKARENNNSDLFTKNLLGLLFEKYTKEYVCINKYMSK